MVGVVIFSIFAVIVIVIIASVQDNKRLKQKAASLGASDFFTALHIEGLGIQPKASSDFYRLSDRLLIEGGGLKFEIPLKNLRAAVVKNERELLEKNKSVVGRALIGTLLVPGLGTIVGGMSGIGSKKKKGAPNTYLIINYMNSNGELAAMTFQNNFNLMKIHNFCKDLNIASNETKSEAIRL